MIAESDSPLPQHLETPPAGAMLGSLDLTNGNDRVTLLRRLKEKRWGEIDNAFKADAIRALKVALRWALEGKDARAVNGIVGTLGYLEGQNQKDDHKAIDVETGVGRTEVNVGIGVSIKFVRGVPEEAV